MRIDLPGGHWADLRGPAELTGADQDTYEDKAAEARALRDARVPPVPPGPDPANPAQMAPVPPPAPFLPSEFRVLKDAVWALVIRDWSLAAPLPFTAEVRRALPLPVVNALAREITPIMDALGGEDPKEDQASGGGTSASSSPGGAGSPLPASAPEPYATPSG